MVLIVNAILLAAAAADRSWGALQIGFVIGPLANLATMGVALLAMILMKRLSPTTDLLAYGIASVLLPLLAVPADFLIIMSMGLHGC